MGAFVNNMFQKIEELKQVRKEKWEMEEKAKRLLTPILKDISLIPKLYRWYEEIVVGKNHSSVMENAYNRKKFFFIILFLYSPGTLLGDKMPSGLRNKLAKCVKLRSVSSVSNCCTGILFLYERYSDFREETNEVYREIAERLKHVL
jgi:hypothetical protein